MTNIKKLGLDGILSLIKQGSSPAKISKEYDIPKQTLTYSLSKLKKMGCIEKKGYSVWAYIKEVPKEPKGSKNSQSKQIRGHAFIWKIEFVEAYDWNRAVRNYNKKKLKFQLICMRKVLRTLFNHRKIWLTQRGLVIYEPMDFFGGSSFQVKGTAVFEMDRLVKAFLEELGLKFRQYRYTTSREHYGIVKNELARQYNDRGEKMNIRGDDGDIWMWIDDSKSLGELENKEVNVNRQVQKFWNDHRKHKFKIDASFVLKGMAHITENQKLFADNIATHIKSVKDLGTGVKELVRVIKELKGGK